MKVWLVVWADFSRESETRALCISEEAAKKAASEGEDLEVAGPLELDLGSLGEFGAIAERALAMKERGTPFPCGCEGFAADVLTVWSEAERLREMFAKVAALHTECDLALREGLNIGREAPKFRDTIAAAVEMVAELRGDRCDVCDENGLIYVDEPFDDAGEMMEVPRPCPMCEGTRSGVASRLTKERDACAQELNAAHEQLAKIESDLDFYAARGVPALPTEPPQSPPYSTLEERIVGLAAACSMWQSIMKGRAIEIEETAAKLERAESALREATNLDTRDADLIAANRALAQVVASVRREVEKLYAIRVALPYPPITTGDKEHRDENDGLRIRLAEIADRAEGKEPTA